MHDRIKKLIGPMVCVAAIIFAGCCFKIGKPNEFGDYLAYVSYAISGVGILFVLYERFIWRVIPLNRPPVLKKEYDGIISYVYKGEQGKKPIKISIEQSWLSIEVRTSTDTNSSQTVTGSIIREHGVDVLYYTYITNPDATLQTENPIQFGTCRMVIDGDLNRIKGKYWTSSKTVGDIEWKAVRAAEQPAKLRNKQ